MQDQVPEVSDSSNTGTVPGRTWSPRAWGLLTAAALAAIAALAIYAYFVTANSVRKMVQKNNESVARTTGELVRNDFERSISLGRAIAGQPALVQAVVQRNLRAAEAAARGDVEPVVELPGDTDPIRDRLEVLVESEPRIVRAYVTDLDGLLWSDFPFAPESIGKNFAHRPWYQVMARSNWEPCVSSVYQRNAFTPGTNIRPLVVAVAIPIFDESEERIGHLVLQYRVDLLANWLKQIDHGQTGQVFVIDENMKLVAHPDLPDKTQEAFMTFSAAYEKSEPIRETLMDDADQPTTQIHVDPLSNSRMVATFLPIEVGRQRWVVIAQQPESDAYAPIYALAMQIGVAGGILALVVGAVMLHLGSTGRTLAAAMKTADDANRMKSAFLANMSHEIRTPMSAIVGYTDLLLDRTQGPSERLNSINALRANAEHLLSLINDILDISKIEAGEMQMERMLCCPCHVLTEVASTMRVRAVERGLGFEIITSGNVPAVIRTDPTRLKQILINLTGNSIKFTHHGHVHVRMDLTDKPDGSGKLLRFQVEDTGIGMSDEQVSRLFRPFTQADSSMTRQYGGTGLGLSISMQLARLLGGDISVFSAPKKGSTFTVTIDPGPLDGIRMMQDCSEAFASTEPAAPAQAAPVRLNGRILLAEDGVHNQQVLSIYLRKAGLDLTIAENGRIACDAALTAMQQGEPFDLILMDMQMPELDGYGATARLREKGYEKPVIALTAHAMAGDRQKCIQAGCTDYLAKPVTRPMLLGMLARYLKTGPSVDGAPDDDAGDEGESIQVSPDKRLQPTSIEPALRPLMKRFISELPGHVARLERLVELKDMQAIRKEVHALRGIAGLYGFSPISSLAGRIEDGIMTGDSADDALEQVRHFMQLVRSVEGYDAAGEKVT